MVRNSRAHFHDAPYYQPRRPRFWRFLKRYQLVELMLIVGGIMLIWFGLSLGPVSMSNGLKLPAGLKSAQIDLPSKPRLR
jgi:hypothetical protein